MGSKDTTPNQLQQQTQQRYQTTLNPTPTETNLSNLSQSYMNNYNDAVNQNKADYGNIMNAYSDFRNNLSPTSFNYQTVSATRPNELNTAYGYLNQAAPGYAEFAQTGGYSPTDIQDLRARGMSPIRTAYANTMQELDRTRALGGGDAGAPNYMAAVADAQRNLPQQMADAEENVNARLAEDIRSGRLEGLSGLTGIGGTEGGLASAEAGRQLSAQEANQQANLQAQELAEQSRQNVARNQLASMQGQTGLYGTTPGMASMFGNQALTSYGQLMAAENMRNQFGLGLLGQQLKAYEANKGQQGFNWMGLLGSAMPLLGKMGGGGSPGGGGNNLMSNGQNNYNDGANSLMTDPNQPWGPYTDPYDNGYQFGPNASGGGYSDFNPNDYGSAMPNPTMPSSDYGGSLY